MKNLSLKSAFQQNYNPNPNPNNEPELVEGIASNYPKLRFDKNSDTKILLELVEQLEKSERGRELLANAEKNNTWIALGNGMMVAQGSYCEKDNRIFINPRINKDKMVATFAHELRHSEQFNTTIDLDHFKDTPRTYLMGLFAIEADANANAALVAWELKQQNINAPWQEFSKEYAHIAKPFEEYAKEGKMADALSAGFNGWYDNKYIRNAYEKNYTKRLDRDYVGHSKDPEVLSRELEPKEIIKKTCAYKKGNYFKGDAQKFATKEYLSLSNDSWWTCWRTYRFTNKGNWSEADQYANDKMATIHKREPSEENGFYSISPKQAAKTAINQTLFNKKQR